MILGRIQLYLSHNSRHTPQSGMAVQSDPGLTMTRRDSELKALAYLNPIERQ